MAKILKKYPEVSLNYEDLSQPIDFREVFGRQGRVHPVRKQELSNRVHIEIGSGRGTFLVNQAKQQPEVNFLGIEWAGRYYRYAVDRIGRWGLNNVRIIRTEAAGFIAEFVPEASIECFHVYFPDPWPKKRHNKRRLVCPSNLEQMTRCLSEGGFIQIATDHADYFDKIKECIDQKTDVLKEVEFVPAAGSAEGEFVGTNYERKYVRQRRRVYTIAVRKAVKKV